MPASVESQPLSVRLAGRMLRLPGLQISSVWIRFLLALSGLLLAFIAALFSSVAREAGNLWETLILASVALLLAIVVGVSTVPYLAKRVSAARIRDMIDYHVTKLGLVYIAVVVLVGIAALNTGNNLLYIVVSAMLAALLVSCVASALVLRHLELEVLLPDHVFAEQRAQARLALRNRRKWLPCFSVSVVPSRRGKEKRQWKWTATTFTFPPKRSAQKQWLKLPDRKLQRVMRATQPHNIFSGITYFPYVPCRGELRADIELHFRRRGRYKEESFGLSTTFPFSFLSKTRHLPLMHEVIAYPSVHAADQQIKLISSIAGEFEAFLRGRGHDLYSLREYMPEDQARRVDWKATAKTGTLKVREFSREDDRKLRIIFDNPVPGVVSAKHYEEAVSLAASLGWHFAAQENEVSFVTQGYRGVDIHDFLKFLATVEAAQTPSILENLEPTGEYNIVITSLTGVEIPPYLSKDSYFAFIQPRH